MAADETIKDRGPRLLERIVEEVLRTLEKHPVTPATGALRDEAAELQRVLEAWRKKRPSEEMRGAIRARVLALHGKASAL
jgi:hypothetical protein